MSQCIFCPGGVARSSILLDGGAWWARLDIHPVSPMHTLIIPKRHITNPHELTVNEWGELRFAAAEVISLIENETTASMRNRYEFIREQGGKLVWWFAEQVLSHPNLGEKPHGYNQGFNQGQAAGQTVDHLHWHIIPRYKGDVEDPRGGIRHVIPRLGNYQALRENNE